jgi:hypothetical protein
MHAWEFDVPGHTSSLICVQRLIAPKVQGVIHLVTSPSESLESHTAQEIRRRNALLLHLPHPVLLDQSNLLPFLFVCQPVLISDDLASLQFLAPGLRSLMSRLWQSIFGGLRVLLGHLLVL